MTRRTVASSFSVGNPTEMRRFCRSFSSTSRRRSANSLELNVFCTNHLSTISLTTRLRSARSDGSVGSGSVRFALKGAAVRTTTAARAFATMA